MVLQLVQGLGFNAIISLTFGAIISESLAVTVLNLDIVNAASSGSAAYLKEKLAGIERSLTYLLFVQSCTTLIDVPPFIKFRKIFLPGHL